MPTLTYDWNGKKHEVPLKAATAIGRAATNEISIPAVSMSSHHAMLTCDKDIYMLNDLGSANGITCNGKKVGTLLLEDGVTFSLGEVKFTFSVNDEPEAILLEPECPPKTEKAAAIAPPVSPIKEALQQTHEKLIVVRGIDKGEEFPLVRERVTLGADDDCTIALDDDGVLSKHAVLEKERGVWHVRALDPSRPIESEGRLLTELRLDHGTTFSLGHALLRFVTPKASIEINPLAGESVGDSEEAVAKLNAARDTILHEVGKIIVGQDAVLQQILVTLFARGHCLIIGVPGLAKTLMVRALAGALDLDTKRIQFTPDLMPSDIIGTDILEEDSATRNRRFRFHRGPLFTNMLLADEINRTPPKTQAALLEAMQERRVTASGITYNLPEPFMVLATQNPIEQEGTYPLPEAQLDRFMFCIHINYPEAADEQRVLLETTRDVHWEVDRVLDAASILRLQHLVRQVPVSEHVALYATNLIRATRPGVKDAPDFIPRWVRWGAGTRAGQFLLLAAKAHVLLNGRFNVSCADIREYALPVLRHRIFCNFAAASEGVTTDDIVLKILDAVKEPSY